MIIHSPFGFRTAGPLENKTNKTKSVIRSKLRKTVFIN